MIGEKNTDNSWFWKWVFTYLFTTVPCTNDFGLVLSRKKKSNEGNNFQRIARIETTKKGTWLHETHRRFKHVKSGTFPTWKNKVFIARNPGQAFNMTSYKSWKRLSGSKFSVIFTVYKVGKVENSTNSTWSWKVVWFFAGQ